MTLGFSRGVEFELDEVNWFLLLMMLTFLGWYIGVRCGRGGVSASRSAVLAAASVLICLTYFVHHPSVAVQVVPVSVLTKIEGVGSVPVFMMILGVAWSRSERFRQRAIVGWAMLFGAVYFVNGGMWMLQQTPTATMGQTSNGGDVMQSQDYTCVPAAAATVLHRLGIEATEAEMAALTLTRPGSGSTTVRALHGLNQKLEGTGYRAELIEVTLAELRKVPVPALTPLQYETTRRHMVAVVGVNDYGLYLVDPIDGRMSLAWDMVEQYFTGQVIVIHAEVGA